MAQTNTRRQVLAVASLLPLFATTRRASAATPLKIGTSGGMNTAIQPVVYARTAGLFAKNGLDVQEVDMTGDTTAVQALIAGEFDLLYTGAGTGMTAIASGADIKLVMAASPWTDYNFLARQGINTLKEMEGKTLGVSTIGSLSYLAPLFALDQAGVNTKSIKFVAIGNDAARGRALSAGSIDGAVLNGVNAVQAMHADPKLHVIADVGSAFRKVTMSTAEFASGAAIREKPAAVEAAVKSLIEACRALQSDKALAIKTAKDSGLPSDAVEGTYDLLFKAPVSYFGVDGGVDRAIVESSLKMLKDGGSISKLPTFDQVVDMQFIDQALKQLGPYKS